jgi:7-carboxy-7-deazaguanine synthase
MNAAEKICICEIFGPTIQGEGASIGRPTVFVRTGGCDYRCRWCDTLYAVEHRYRKDWIEMSAEDILAQVYALSGGRPLMVSLSGGNPALQPLGGLLALGKASGYSFALETQGSVAQEWFAELDILTLSPKPPSSGMSTDLQRLQECVAAGAGGAATALKFVVLDAADYLYAREVARVFPHLPVYLQPCNYSPPGGEDEFPADAETVNCRMLWLVERVLADAWFAARVLPQLHVMLWGNRRGV